MSIMTILAALSALTAPAPADTCTVQAHVRVATNTAAWVDSCTGAHTAAYADNGNALAGLPLHLDAAVWGTGQARGVSSKPMKIRYTYQREANGPCYLVDGLKLFPNGYAACPA